MLESVHANMRRTAAVLLAGFVVVSIALGYWQIWRSQDLAEAADNPRVADARLSQPRGSMFDRTGQLLVSSQSTPGGEIRSYADPSLVHTTGFHSSRFGDTDLEATFDADLRGEHSPSTLQRLRNIVAPSQPQPSDLVLTIDKRIHDAAISALGDANGAIVAIDPQTGAVLAMASKPYFDPNAPDDVLAALQNDPSQPLYNRAVQARYVPGSTFKSVTATAALDLGLVDLGQAFACTTAVSIDGYSVNCNNSLKYPRPIYKQAFAWSSNRVFALSGLLLGFPGPMNPWLDDHPPGTYPWDQPGASIQPSAARLEQYAGQFGFGRSIPFDFPVTPSDVKLPDDPWTPPLLAETSFGQGELQVTPMQMALVVAAVANQGRVPAPYVVSSVRAPDGALRQVHQPGTTFSQAMSPQTAATLKTFFEEGVVDGYAENAAIPNVVVGGKTGTAEVGDGTVHSWFIGYAPSNNPTVAVAVIMERQTSDLEPATPAGRDVMEAALKYYTR